MSDIDTIIAEVRRLDAEATPGEWQWYGNTYAHSCYLATVHSGRIYVLDFVRWGMQDAQPRFRWPVGADAGIMYSLAKMPSECGPRFEVEYRRDFAGINHPDAELITYYRTAAPLLVGEVERLRAEVERLTRDRDRLAGYVRAALPLARDAHKHLLEERPEEAARAIFRVICALASAVEEGADQ